MAEERTGQRTYRRKPADIAEATYIAALINADVAANTTTLAEAREHDKLYTLLGYQRDWNGIVAELSRPGSNASPTPKDIVDAAKANAEPPPAPEPPPQSESTPGGGQSRSRTRTPQTA